MQHFGGQEAHHRRAMEKRQIRTVITSVVVEDDETFTTRITTRVPLISIPRPPATTAVETTARATSATTPPPARPSSSARSTRPTSSSSSSVSSSVVPSSSASSLATSRPVASSSSQVTSESEKTTTVFVPTTPSPSASNAAGNSNDTVGATSTGQTVGIVVGVIAGVIGVAIFAAFIVRHMRKRARDKESWDASKFRRSALLLGGENNGGPGGPGPRPPSMIERRENANTASMVGAPTRAYPFTDGPAGGFQSQDQLGYSRAGTPLQPQQYGAPNPYGAAPIPYTGQNMYGQGAERGYGNAAVGMGAGFGAGAAYGARTGTPHQGMDTMDMHHPGYPVRSNGHNSLPPFASYALPPIDTGAPPTVARTNTTASNLPNPFAERAPAQAPPSPRDSGSSGHGSASGAPIRSNQPRYMTRNGDEDEQDQREAPPAYTDDGSYAKMQRDVKNPVVMSVEGTTAPSTAAAPVPATPAPAPASAPAPAPAPSTNTMGNNRARPMSSHTVYDPSDAYGGM